MDTVKFEDLILTTLSDRIDLMPVALGALVQVAGGRIDYYLKSDPPDHELAEKWQEVSDGLHKIIERLSRGG